MTYVKWPDDDSFVPGDGTLNVDGNVDAEGSLTGSGLLINGKIQATDNITATNGLFVGQDYGLDTNEAGELVIGQNNQTGIIIGRFGQDTAITNLVCNGADINFGNKEIEFGSASGVRLATATNQKFAFYGQDPVIQPGFGEISAGYLSVGGSAVLSESTFTGNTGSAYYTIGDIVNVLKTLGLIAMNE